MMLMKNRARFLDILLDKQPQMLFFFLYMTLLTALTIQNSFAISQTDYLLLSPLDHAFFRVLRLSVCLSVTYSLKKSLLDSPKGKII